jgi:hypothetical protein
MLYAIFEGQGRNIPVLWILIRINLKDMTRIRIRINVLSWIRFRIKVKGRIRIQFRICIKITSSIRVLDPHQLDADPQH